MVVEEVEVVVLVVAAAVVNFDVHMFDRLFICTYFSTCMIEFMIERDRLPEDGLVNWTVSGSLT